MSATMTVRPFSIGDRITPAHRGPIKPIVDAPGAREIRTPKHFSVFDIWWSERHASWLVQLGERAGYWRVGDFTLVEKHRPAA